MLALANLAEHNSLLTSGSATSTSAELLAKNTLPSDRDRRLRSAPEGSVAPNLPCGNECGFIRLNHCIMRICQFANREAREGTTALWQLPCPQQRCASRI